MRVVDPSPIRKSYAKTAIASVALLLMALFAVLAGLYRLPGLLGTGIAALGALAAIVAAMLASSSIVVLLRHARAVRVERDLFLELNRSREPAAIRAAAPVRATLVRRWLARQLLGHDLVVGDLVEIKTWSEIRATLDEQGCLEQLPFMPEMLPMCGQRAYVFRCMHRLFDYRKSRLMRHMDGAVLLVGAVCDGSGHGGCEAACHTIWKSAWLRRIERSRAVADAFVTPSGSEPEGKIAGTRFVTAGLRYDCQLTRLNAASRAIGKWSVANFLRPLIGGNVALAAFVVGWLTNLFNEVQQKRRGTGFPDFEPAMRDGDSIGELRLAEGDHVVVRSSGEIRATLNDELIHRGLGFELDMLKHCGRRYCVQGEVRKLVDIVTGEMRVMKTPAYILRDVHFSGERQLFNSQYEPLFWRGLWLRRVGD